MAVIDDAAGRRIDVASPLGGIWFWLSDIPGFERIEVGDATELSHAAAGEWVVILDRDAGPVTLHLPSGDWERHEDSGIDGWSSPNTVWTGEQLVVWGGAEAPATPAIWTP